MRTRFWTETAAAALSGLLCILTVAWSDWIELVFRAAPDNGNGSLESLLTATFLAATVILGTLAYVESTRLADTS